MATSQPNPSKVPKTVADLNASNIRTDASMAIVHGLLDQESTAYTRGLQAISSYKATLERVKGFYEAALTGNLLEKVRNTPESLYYKITAALERAGKTLHLDELAGKAQSVLDRAAVSQSPVAVLESYVSELQQADESYRLTLSTELFGKISLVKDSPWSRLYGAIARVSKVRDIARIATSNTGLDLQTLRDRLAKVESEKSAIELDLRRYGPMLIQALGAEVKRVDHAVGLYKTLFPEAELKSNNNYNALLTLRNLLSGAIEEQQMVNALESAEQNERLIGAAETEILQQAKITVRVRDENHKAAMTLEEELLEKRKLEQQVSDLRKEDHNLRDKLASAATERDTIKAELAAEKAKNRQA